MADTHRPRDTEEVVIVGGGIVGISIAYALRHSDRSVTLLEKNALGSGTTGASIAQFIRHQTQPTRAEAERRQLSWEWYEPRIAEDIFSFDQCGTLHVAAGQAEWDQLKRLATAHADLDIVTDVLESPALERFGLDPSAVQGGFFLPDDGVLDPTEIVQYCASEAREAGVSIETSVTVTGIDTSGGNVDTVRTAERTYPAATVVNAAGPWASELNEWVGVTAPLRHTSGPILVLQTERDVSLPLTFFEDEIYLRREADCQILAGEFSTDFEDAERVDPDSTWPIRESFYIRVAEIVERYLSSTNDYRVQNEWLGIRTVTPDGYPIVGETSVDGYYLAAGMSGHGITHAPMIGEAVATLIESGETPKEITPLSNARF